MCVGNIPVSGHFIFFPFHDKGGSVSWYADNAGRLVPGFTVTLRRYKPRLYHNLGRGYTFSCEEVSWFGGDEIRTWWWFDDRDLFRLEGLYSTLRYIFKIAVLRWEERCWLESWLMRLVSHVYLVLVRFQRVPTRKLIRNTVQSNILTSTHCTLISDNI